MRLLFEALPDQPRHQRLVRRSGRDVVTDVHVLGPAVGVHAPPRAAAGRCVRRGRLGAAHESPSDRCRRASTRVPR